MNAIHLGDSYDLVKQVLLRSLGSIGPWDVHPMLTAAFDDEQESCFAKLLGAPLLSCEVLEQKTDRRRYLAPAARSPRHVFLDPDIGLRLKSTHGKKAPAYLFGDELVAIAQGRPDCLTLVYDQCLPRGKELSFITEKRAWLSNRGLSSVAYRSHASFLVVSPDPALVRKARSSLLSEGRIPASRLVG